MITSEVAICNIAILNLGGNPIISLDDGTNEAIICSVHYEPCRDAVLEARDWTFATDRRRLTPMAESPAFGFSHQFLLPSDNIRVFEAGIDPDFLDRIIWTKEATKILANNAEIYIRYVRRVVDPVLFSAGFVKALAARLTWDICIPLTNNPRLEKSKKEDYEDLLSIGGTYDGMQGVNIPVQPSKLVDARRRSSLILR